MSRATTRESVEVTDETVERILAYWKARRGYNSHKTYLYFALLAHTGGRRSEVLGFFPEDFRELPSGEWVVNFQRQRTAKPKGTPEAYDEKLKTARSYRFVIIPKELGEETQAYIEAKEIPDGHPIFPNARRAANYWSDVTKKALGLDPRLRLHDFEAYYVRKVAPLLLKRLKEKGVDIDNMSPRDFEELFGRS